MNRERSFFEHKGMPLTAVENAGRVRETPAPWLQSFTRRPAVDAEERKRFPDSPALSLDSSLTEDTFPPGDAASEVKAGGRSNAPPAEPDVMLRRSVAGSAASTPAPVNPAGAGSRSSTTPGPARGNAEISVMGRAGDAHAGRLDPPWKEPGVSPLEVLPGDRQRPLGVGENAMPLPAMAGAGASPASSGNDSRQPDISIQKRVTIHATLPPFGHAAGDSPAAALSNVQVVKSPMSLPWADASESRADSLRQNPFEAATEQSQERRAGGTQIEPVRMEMSGSTSLQVGVRVVMPAPAKAHTNRSQQELLERFNQRAPQQQPGGRRVHIRNLHITVQKAATPQPQPAPTQPQPAAAAPQSFFNPWERHLSAFD